jgi:hypothetical protein
MIRTTVLAAMAIAALGGPSAAAAEPVTNPDGTVTSDELVIDGSAEAGLSGWQSSPGWRATSYSDPGERAPAPDPQFYGARFFDPGSQASATLSQNVDLSSFSAPIDTGRQAFSFGLSVLTWADRDDTAILRATPLDASGQPSGVPVEAGGPTAADRSDRSAIVVCGGQVSALPIGTRAVRLDITSTASVGTINHAGVDAISGMLGYPTAPGIGAPPIGKGCSTLYASAAELPQPLPARSTDPASPAMQPARLTTTSAVTVRGRFAVVRILSSAAGMLNLKLSTTAPQFALLARSTRRVSAGRTTLRLALSRTTRRKLAGKHRPVRLIATLKAADGRSATLRKITPLR